MIYETMEYVKLPNEEDIEDRDNERIIYRRHDRNPFGLQTAEIPLGFYYQLKHAYRDFNELKRLLGVL